jgi:hypothetical protein
MLYTLNNDSITYNPQKNQTAIRSMHLYEIIIVKNEKLIQLQLLVEQHFSPFKAWH